MKWAAILLLATTALQFGDGEARIGRLSGRKRTTSSGSSGNSSSVKCVAIASGRSKSYSKSSFVSLGADIAAELCSTTGSEAVITVAVDSVAQAFAYAVAETSVGCVAVGNAKGSASATAKAEAQAEATAEALLEGFVSVETCNGCKAAAELFLTSFERVLAHAVAESKSKVEVNAEKLGRDQDAKKSVVTTVVDLVLPIQSELTTTVKTAIKDGEETCNVYITGCTRAGSEGGCCDLTVANTARAIEVDAIAEAGAGAQAEAAKCSEDNDLEASATAVAVAMARAYAEAVVGVDAFCETTENSSACLWAEASQEKMAEAQAQAFASAWAKANSGCKCKVSLEATATAVEAIYASATADVFLSVCSEGEGMAGVSAVAKAYEDQTVEAVALALADAVVDGEDCGAAVAACADVRDNYACCDIIVDNTASTFSQDAIAEVSVAAGLFTCGGGEGAAEARATAEAIAVAWAKVVTSIDAYCDSNGDASACGVGESSISAAARAQAKAFAEAWAGTLDSCDCELALEAAVQVVSEVLVEVTLHLQGEICVANGGVFDEQIVIAAIGDAQITAIAQALAKVKQEETTCEAEVTVDAATTVS